MSHVSIDGTITEFKEVFKWINYDYESHYPLTKCKDGTFVVNKLYITRTELSYKTELYKLGPGLYEKVDQLWKMLQPIPNSVKFSQEE